VRRAAARFRGAQGVAANPVRQWRPGCRQRSGGKQGTGLGPFLRDWRARFRGRPSQQQPLAPRARAPSSPCSRRRSTAGLASPPPKGCWSAGAKGERRGHKGERDEGGWEPRLRAAARRARAPRQSAPSLRGPGARLRQRAPPGAQRAAAAAAALVRAHKPPPPRGKQGQQVALGEGLIERAPAAPHAPAPCPAAPLRRQTAPPRRRRRRAACRGRGTAGRTRRRLGLAGRRACARSCACVFARNVCACVCVCVCARARARERARASVHLCPRARNGRPKPAASRQRLAPRRPRRRPGRARPAPRGRRRAPTAWPLCPPPPARTGAAPCPPRTPPAARPG
jgi:hypothetical protein